MRRGTINVSLQWEIKSSAIFIYVIYLSRNKVLKKFKEILRSFFAFAVWSKGKNCPIEIENAKFDNKYESITEIRP